MKQNHLSKLFIVLFLLLSLLPVVGMLFQGEAKSAANEILSSAPKLLDTNGKLNQQVLKESSNYIADRFFLRKQLVTAWAKLNAKLLKTSAEEQVILGSKGWLYYTPSLEDYIGRSVSDEELEHAAKNLASIQEYAESRGVRFLFTVAPNKNSLYAEHMPSYIPYEHEEANIRKLMAYLNQYGVHYCDLFTAFAAQDEILYYETDSHWTNRGAALAADTLLRAAGKESCYFDGAFTAGEGHTGDLYEMLYPTGQQRECSADYAPGFSYSVSGDARGGEALRITTHNEAAKGSLICWRDSFGNSLFPYLADSFADAQFLRSAKYDLGLIDSLGADTVIIEIVERNIPQLAHLDPQIPD